LLRGISVGEGAPHTRLNHRQTVTGRVKRKVGEGEVKFPLIRLVSRVGTSGWLTARTFASVLAKAFYVARI
jgi:hypothetical protein